MSDDNNSYYGWRQQAEREIVRERRAHLFGGSKFDNGGGGGGGSMADARSIIQSFTGTGLLIGLFLGAITADRSGMSVMQGIAIGAAGGASVGAGFGVAVVKAFAGVLATRAAMRTGIGVLDAMTGGYLGSAWQGAKWGAMAGGGGSLITGNGGGIVEWVVPMAGAGAVAGVGLSAAKKAIGRMRGY